MKMVLEVFAVCLLAFVSGCIFCDITGLREVAETTLITAITLVIFNVAYVYKL